MNTFVLESLTSKTKSFQSTNSTCTDFIQKNQKDLFKNPKVLEAGISHQHSFITTLLRSQLVIGNSKMKIYRDYKTFNIDTFN